MIYGGGTAKGGGEWWWRGAGVITSCDESSGACKNSRDVVALGYDEGAERSEYFATKQLSHTLTGLYSCTCAVT